MRLWLIAGLGLPLLIPSGAACAQVRNDDEFYSLLTNQSPAPAIPDRAEPRRGKTAKVARSAPEANSPSSLPTPSANQPPPPPPPMERQQALMSALLSLSPISWAMILAAIAALGTLLWAATPLPCLVLGHRRYSRTVRFDEHEQRWIGQCKSCGKLLARREGKWRSADATWHKPQIVRSPTPNRPPADYEVANSGLQESVGYDVPIVEWPLRDKIRWPSNSLPAPVRDRTQLTASQLVDDVRSATAPDGSLFSVTEKLRARCAADEETLCTEKIAMRMQELGIALHRDPAPAGADTD